MDVKTSFLHGNLPEDVYMIQPEGFGDPREIKKYENYRDQSMN